MIMKKCALLNIIFNPKDASKMDEYLAYLEENGYEVAIEPEWRTIPTEELLIEKLESMDAFIGSTVPFTARVMDARPNCKIISRTGVGYESIDIPAATERGVAVCITPGVGAEAVSEYSFALMMAAARRVMEADRSVRAGQWIRFVGSAVWHKTLGIVGMGRIGKKLVEIAHGLDMKVVAFDMFHDEAFARKHHITYYDSLDEMLKICDFVSVHANLTDQTRGMIGMEQFKIMKPTAVIVNAARGGIVNEQDLCHALANKMIAAAGMDVYEKEPMPADHPFLQLDNIILSSHNAGSSAEGKNSLIEAAFRNLIAVENGEEPDGLLNPDYDRHGKCI
jgi:phosphoglycerate dehydrogenase-like enzyme